MRIAIPINIPVASFYTLEWLKIEADKFTSPTPSQEKLTEDINEAYEQFAKQFAKLLHDYIALICLGEARHAFDHCSFYIPSLNLRGARNEIYAEATRYDPKDILRKTRELFGHMWKDRDYGGHAWYRIASAGLLYYEVPAASFIDHCVDLHHNRSLIFDKAETNIFEEPLDRHIYMDILSAKNNSEIRNLSEWISYLAYLSRLRCVGFFPSIVSLVKRAYTLSGRTDLAEIDRTFFQEMLEEKLYVTFDHAITMQEMEDYFFNDCGVKWGTDTLPDLQAHPNFDDDDDEDYDEDDEDYDEEEGESELDFEPESGSESEPEPAPEPVTAPF